jgi:replicative DNA helicase
MKSHISKSINQPLNQTMSELDRIYSNQIEALDSDGEPEELFDNILELVEERGNSPQEVMGYSTPYEEFNKQYGGFRGGNIYAFASRTGQGKSTLLMDAASGTAKINKIKCLVLDTEMETTEVKFRTAAANSGVPLHFLETGKWRKNPDFIEKVRKNLKNLKQEYQTYHYYVGNKNVDEVCSIIRRWMLNVVGRGNGAIVVYDYLKLTGEKLANNWAEHQAIGEKVDKLKRICVEFNFPLLTAIQINRTGTNSGRSSKDVVDDDSVISLSDRLLWFASFVAIFRRRTEDEIILDTPESGSHKCIVLKSRSDGIESRGHNTLIRRTFPDGTSKYVLNFLNFDIQNFKVEERGSLADSIMRQNAQHLVIDGAGSADERPL